MKATVTPEAYLLIERGEENQYNNPNGEILIMYQRTNKVTVIYLEIPL
jgi:hypothetical protein